MPLFWLLDCGTILESHSGSVGIIITIITNNNMSQHKYLPTCWVEVMQCTLHIFGCT